MASVPRPILATTPAVVGGRPPAGARNVATSNSTPVSDISAGAGVAPESFAQNFHDFAFTQDRRHKGFTPNGRGQLNFGASTDFIASFEVRDVGDAANESGQTKGGNFLHRLSIVTGLYERNAKAGMEDTSPRGETYNFSL